MKYWIIMAVSIAVIVGAIVLIVLTKKKHKYADKFTIALSVFTVIAIIVVLSAWYGIKA